MLLPNFISIIAWKSQYVEIMKAIGNTIKERRKVLSTSQRELAELAGVSINTLTKIERGEGNPSIEILNRILETLGLEIDIRVKSNNL